jgi:hypothetical protein
MSDIINWLDGMIGRAMHGPMHQFTFSRKGDYSGVEVEIILRQYGIRVWGREADADEIGILVKRKQAVWAEYLLCRAGVPLTSELLDPRNAAYRQRHAHGAMPTPWTERGIRPHTIIDHIVDWIHRTIG